MKKSGKLTALLLAAVMLAASLIACVGETPPAVTTGKPVTEGTGGEVTTETSGPGIDKVDFKGRTIRSASCDGWKFILEDSDDPIDSAKYRAACFIEDKYNVKLDSYNGDNSAQLAPMIQESAMTGDYEYDLVFPHATYGVTEMIIQNCLTDWNGLRYVDFDKPWWGRQAIDALAIKDKVFYAYGDITLTSTNFCFEVVNSSLLNDIGYTNNLYQMVFDGNWTTDELIRIASMGTKDLDGDGNFTPDKDQYGFLTNDCFAHRMYAMGSRITELNSEGIPEVVINTPHMQNVVEKFYDLFWSDGTYYSTFTHNTILDTEYFRIMSEGRAVAMDFEIGLFRPMRNLDYEYMLLPFPKYDENQKDYVCFTATGLIGICATNRDIDCIDMIVEDFAHQNYLYVRPAYYDIVLDQKIAQDDDSQKVLDIMFAHTTYDPGYNYETTHLGMGLLQAVVVDRHTTSAQSYIKKIEDRLNNSMAEIIDELYSH